MTVPFDEALAMIARRCRPMTPILTVSLTDADRRVLAEDIVAPISVPPADNSAVDGYAFRHADLGQGPLPVIGVAAAGRPFTGTVAAGQAVRIFTGAVPPAGCDSVVMQEATTIESGRVSIPPDIPVLANIRRAGEDIQAGAPMMTAGRRLRPAEIGLLAAAGIAGISAYAPVRVAVFSSGDELAQPGGTLRPGAIYDANRPMLVAALVRLGCSVTDMGILPDGRAAIGDALAAAVRDHDAIVTSGGVSVGDEDHIRAAVLSLGGLDFQGVALKPGRPMTAGHIAGVPFFGLPGNPVAAMVNFAMLARPGLLSLAGARPAEPRRIPLAADFSVSSQSGRRDFLRAKLAVRNGQAVVALHGRGGSGVLSSLADCDGLIELDETITAVTPGMTVSFIPLHALDL